MVLSSPMFYVNYRRLVDLSALHHLPTRYVTTEFVDAGGLIAHGADLPDLVRLAAKCVGKILKGTNPGDLPVEQQTKFAPTISIKAAKPLGVTIPQMLLSTADRVIE